jgi:Rrf2 family protein
MQLKTQTDYAIRIMLYLSEKGEGTRKEMAAVLGINEFYLPKIIKPLRDQKWIVSATGSTGGFTLTGKPDKITMLDIIEVMEGPIEFDHIEEDGSQGSTMMEPVRKVYQTYQEHLKEYFSSITLADLLESEKSVRI